jgi:hypothetical protein
MATKKKGQLSKHCRIFQWVEAQDPDLAAAIRDLCLERALSPAGPAGGVTFLYPKEKEYRAEIVSKAYSDEAEEAVKLIESLIIPDALVQGADFSRRPVGSKLGVKYVVESADSMKVKIANGVELVPSSDFSPLESRANKLAIWVIAKGRLPLKGEAYKAPPPERRAKHGGGDSGVSGIGLNDRQLLAANTEGEFDRCMKRDKCRSHNPYLAKVVSLLNYLKAKAGDVLLKVMPVLDYDPVVTFYLLLEPYKTRGEHLIPDSLLFGDGAWNGADAYGNAVSEYEAIFRALPNQQAMSATDSSTGSPVIPWAFRDRAAVAAQVDVLRQQFGAANPREGPRIVQDVYAVLAGQNSIGGMAPILPDSTNAALAGSKKLWQDEFRFTVHEALQEMRQTPYSTDTFASIVRDLRTAWPGNNYSEEICLSHVSDIKSNVGPRPELLLLTKFVNSTDFLYMPVAPDIVGGAWGSMDPTDWQVYNRNAITLGNLRRTTGMVRSAGVSPETLTELQVYVQTYGQLPPEVVGLTAARR